MESDPSAGIRPTATVAICTRDRPRDLARCLQALQRLPDDGQEILVVDNCPSDEATRRLVAGYDGVRYVREARPGLSVARNRALGEAGHQIVAFTDDDDVPDPGWLRGLLRNFDDPQVLGVTGLTLPLELETDPQRWFESCSSQGRGSERRVFERSTLEPAAAGLVGVGNNMALRRAVVDLVGTFNEILGAGTPLRAGEEFELFARILAAGYRLVYDPAALCRHRHPRTRPQVRQRLYGYGLGTYAFWTQRLLLNRDWAALKNAGGWLWRFQLPALLDGFLRRPDHIPPDLVLAQLGGCALGPWMYLASLARWRLQGNRET